MNYTVAALALSAILFLPACENWQNAGINRAHITSPTGEEWDIVSGKDQTDTELHIERDANGNITALYKSAKEDATAALKAAFDSLSTTISKLTDLVATLKTPVVAP